MARALTREEVKEARRAARREERRAERRASRARARSRSRSRHHRHRGSDSDESAHGSRPTGKWTEAEKAQGWIVSRSSQWSSQGRVKIVDKDAFMETGETWLDWWKDRVATENIGISERKDFMKKLYDLATDHGHVCGKWMVFAPLSVVDALWVEIKKANEKGQLGGCCKVCTYNSTSDTHLICVYVRDFNDVAEAQRVLYNLHNICASFGVRIIANFKADFLTALGVYKSASSNIACRYTLKDLNLIKEWPNRRLKRILDNLKKTVRKLEEEEEENNRSHRRSRSRARNHR